MTAARDEMLAAAGAIRHDVAMTEPDDWDFRLAVADWLEHVIGTPLWALAVARAYRGGSL